MKLQHKEKCSVNLCDIVHIYSSRGSCKIMSLKEQKIHVNKCWKYDISVRSICSCEKGCWLRAEWWGYSCNLPLYLFSSVWVESADRPCDLTVQRCSHFPFRTNRQRPTQAQSTKFCCFHRPFKKWLFKMCWKVCWCNTENVLQAKRSTTLRRNHK